MATRNAQLELSSKRYRVSTATMHKNGDFVYLKTILVTGDYYEAIAYAKEYFEKRKANHVDKNIILANVVHSCTGFTKSGNLEYKKCVACFSTRLD